MATEKLQVILELLASQYKKEVRDAGTATDRLTDSLKKTGQTASRIGTQLTTNLTLPIAGLAVGAVKAASDLAESMNAINVVFKESAGVVEAFGETAAESAGLSQRAFNEAVIPIGQLLGNFGFSADLAADAVIDLTQRAADLGSVLNVDTAVALDKFQKGLAGESEPLKAFGVDVSVAAIKAEALALGLIKSGEEMSKSVRAQAALSIIMRETSFAAGDFANTLETSLPNQLKQLKADAEDVAAALGTAMLPALLDVVGGVQGMVDKFTDLSVAQQEFIVKTGLTVAALGPAVFVVGKLVTLYKNLRTAILGAIAASQLRGVQIIARGGTGLPPPVPIGGAATAASGFSRLAGVLGTVTGAAWLTAEALRAVLDIEDDVEAATHIQERAWSARDAQVRVYGNQVSALALAMKDAQKDDDSYVVAMVDVGEAAAETALALEDAEEASKEARARALELRDANREAAKSFRADLTNAIAGFVTFFDGAVDEIDVSLKQLETQFEERRTQNERFWNGLAVLAAAGLDDLVAELQSQGPEVAAVVEDLVADMDRAFAWEQRIEETRRDAEAMANALANGLNGVKDTVGAAFNAFGISLARQLEAGFSTADLGNTMTQLMDLADQFGGGTTTPGGGGSQYERFHSGGVVPGLPGSERLIMALAGERVLPTHKAGSGSGDGGGGGLQIVVQSPMGNFQQDLQYATILASVTNLVEGL